MIVVEMVGPNGTRAEADSVLDGDELEVVFDSIPEGYYTQLWVDGVAVTGFRHGKHSGRARFIIAWRPAVVQQRFEP